MIQYKHNPTGKVYVKVTLMGYHFYAEKDIDVNRYDVSKIPEEIVEKGSDWEKIKEFALQSDDNVEIYKGDYYFVINKVNFSIEKRQADYIFTKSPNFIYFSCKERAIKFVEYNSPNYSLNQIFFQLTKYNIHPDILLRLEEDFKNLKK